MKKRMGQVWNPDQAIQPILLKCVLQLMDDALRRSQFAEEGAMISFCAFYFAACYCVSLRGPEGLLFDVGAID